MVSQTILYRNDISGEPFETKLQDVDAEFRSRYVGATQRGAFSERTEDW